MGAFLKLNDGTNPCVAINNVRQNTPPNGEIAATDIAYVIPCTYKYGGALVPMVTAYVALNNTTPIPYIFNVSTVAGFLTFLSGLSVTNTLSTYTALRKINGTKNNSALTALPSALVNTALILTSNYNALKNQTTIGIGVNSQDFPNVVLTFVGNQTSAGVAATASLAVPVSATPTNTDSITALINGAVFGTYTVSGSPTQATVKTAVDTLFNSNGLGFTFVGTLATNVDTLAGTAPTKGTFYNGQTVSFTRTGTTFGASNVSATFASGV